jgi:hypothetical protein
MNTRLKIGFLGLIASLCLGFKVDETPLEKLLKQLAKITSSYPQEKVHLHLDKPYYAIGEDIWLKAYVVNASKNEPSPLSAVLYVELIDQKDEIKKKEKLEIVNGEAHGNINLVDSLSSGSYRIRAYTNYMRNFGDSFFFQKIITIGNVAEKQVASKTKVEKFNLDVQFFPEGGNMLVGVRNKIGVKAVVENGFGANLSGHILNSKKEKIAIFNTEHAGMGAFAITPSQNERYTAVVIMPDGQEKTFKFPQPTESGFSIAIGKTSENLNVRVLATQDKIGAKNMFVIAQSNGIACASFTIPLTQQNNNVNIPLKSFPTGIIHFTLFNAEAIALAQRLVFVNHHDQLKMEVSQKSAALTKQKMELSLAVNDLNENPVDGGFSVAITDMAQVISNEDEEITILSNLLLTSDLKGYIEKPNYYFNTINEGKEKQLDNLLLTQGWRRFVWGDIATEKVIDLDYRIEKTIEVSGKIANEFGKPKANARISLFAATNGKILKLDTISNTKGNFTFDRLEFPDSTSVMLMAKIGKDNKAIKLSLNDHLAVEPYKLNGNTINIESYLSSTKKMFEELSKFNMLNKGIMLKEVVITKQRDLKPLLNVPNSVNASGAADYVFTRKMLEKDFHILSPFGRIPGVIVKFNKVFRLRGQRNFQRPNGPMLLIVDGIKINQDEQPDFLTSLYPGDIEGIEVLTSNYNLSVLGSDAADGAIYITTRIGKPGVSIATNTGKIVNAGFSTKKEFYIPKYDDPKTDKQMLDLRSTIYWNPTVRTDEKGFAKFSFFNAGTPGKYQVTIEGLDIFGNVGRKTYTYEVK